MADYKEWLGTSAEGIGTELIQEGTGYQRELIVRTTQDAEPIIEGNKRMRQHQEHARGTPHLGGYHAARIPTTIYYQWKQEWQKQHADKWTWHTYLAMKINNRDYAEFRVNSDAAKRIS